MRSKLVFLSLAAIGLAVSPGTAAAQRIVHRDYDGRVRVRMSWEMQDRIDRARERAADRAADRAAQLAERAAARAEARAYAARSLADRAFVIRDRQIRMYGRLDHVRIVRHYYGRRW
jgi:hypothetical protein